MSRESMRKTAFEVRALNNDIGALLKAARQTRTGHVLQVELNIEDGNVDEIHSQDINIRARILLPQLVFMKTRRVSND